MNCSDVEKYIYVYLDEEFDRKDSLELEAHLRECKPCRDLCAFEERFRVRLRNQLSGQRAPSSLRDRVISCIANPPATTEISGLHAREPSVRWVPVALAASVAAVVFWPFSLGMDSSSIRTAGLLGIGAPHAEEPTGPLSSEPEDPSEQDDAARGIERNVVAEAVETHEDNLPMDVVGDATTVGRYLTTRTLVRMAPPLPETRETRLVGVRVLRTGLRPTAMYTYDHLGRRMTVVQRLIQRQSIPDERLNPSLVALRRAGRLNVAVLRSEAAVSAVVSDMPEQDLAGLIPSNYTAPWAAGH